MKIKLYKDGQVWAVKFNSITTYFANYDGATEFALKAYKRFYKENAAYARLCRIFRAKLSEPERELYDKLSRTKCKGITKGQYGFLAGIYERQEREW